MKIMDCTLRDGANVVGNGFSPELTRMMIEGLLRSNIRIIEMGNAKGLGATEKGSPAPISDGAYLDLIHPYLDRAEIGMFLNAKRFEADNVAMAADKGISFLRLGADAGDGKTTYDKAAIIKKHGIKVRYSLMKAYLLTPEELASLKDYLTGQAADGWGEGFEQHEIQVDGGELYVHLWQWDNWSIQTEQEQFAPKIAESLPKLCFSTLASTGQLICIKRGETGYDSSEWDTGDKERNVELADELNENLGVTPAQRQAMEVGSLAGWDVPGADPKNYEIQKEEQLGGMTFG